MTASHATGYAERRTRLGCGVVQRGDIQGVELRIVQNVRQGNLLRNRCGGLLRRLTHRGTVAQGRTRLTLIRLVRVRRLRSLLSRWALLRSAGRARGGEIGRHTRRGLASGGSLVHSRLLRGFGPGSNARGLLRGRLLRRRLRNLLSGVGLSGLHGLRVLSRYCSLGRRLRVSSSRCGLRGRPATALLVEEHATAADGLESARALGAALRMLCVARSRGAAFCSAVGRRILLGVGTLSGTGLMHSRLMHLGLGCAGFSVTTLSCRHRSLRGRSLRGTLTTDGLCDGSLGGGNRRGASLSSRSGLFGFTVKLLIIEVDLGALVFVIVALAVSETLTQGICQTKAARGPGQTTQHGENHEPCPGEQTKEGQKQAQHCGNASPGGDQVGHTRGG